MTKPAKAEITTGHCQCGAIRYEFEGKPKWVMHCHCENCRRAVSSAVATYIGVNLGQFRYLQGEPAVYELVARREALFLRPLRLADGLCRCPLAGRGAPVPWHSVRSGAVAANRARLRQRAGSVVRPPRRAATLREDGWAWRRTDPARAEARLSGTGTLGSSASGAGIDGPDIGARPEPASHVPSRRRQRGMRQPVPRHARREYQCRQRWWIYATGGGMNQFAPA